MKHSDYLIVVAGGTGSRMKSETPKQFLKINGVPIIILAIKQFLSVNPEIKIVIAVHKNYIKHLLSLTKKYFNNKNVFIVVGGDTRFQSVKNALQILPNSKEVVAIHDAARPFVSKKVIDNCINTARIKGNATPAVDLAESIRVVDKNKNKAVNRSNYKIVQTPQCFVLDQLKKAFTKKYSPKFTDDASVFESAGHKINLVEGNTENIKITNPSDLIIAKAFVKHDK